MPTFLIMLMLIGVAPNENDCWITQNPPYKNPLVTTKQEQISVDECIKIVSRIFEIKDMSYNEFHKIRYLIFQSPNRKKERKRLGILEFNYARINDIIYCRLKKVIDPGEKKKVIALLLKLLSTDMTHKHIVTIDNTDFGSPPWHGWFFSALDTLSVIGDKSIIPQLKELYRTCNVSETLIYKNTIKELGGMLSKDDMEKRKEYLKNVGHILPSEANY